MCFGLVQCTHFTVEIDTGHSPSLTIHRSKGVSTQATCDFETLFVSCGGELRSHVWKREGFQFFTWEIISIRDLNVIYEPLAHSSSREIPTACREKTETEKKMGTREVYGENLRSGNLHPAALVASLLYTPIL